MLSSPLTPPRTAPAPSRPPVGSGQTNAIAVPPRPREPGAIWTPRRWLCDLPAVVDEDDFDGWLRATDAGERVSYHVGLLARDRLADEALDNLARAICFRSANLIYGVTKAPCGHVRRIWRGSADVLPVQERLAVGIYLCSVRRLETERGRAAVAGRA
jgi:hypothetical protein